MKGDGWVGSLGPNEYRFAFRRPTISQFVSKAFSPTCSLWFFLAEFLETRIISKRIEHWIEPE